jgi:hypothetical protein
MHLHTRKRKRGDFEASNMLNDQFVEQSLNDQPLTQSKVTRRRLELDCQIAFLQDGFRLKTAAWPNLKMSKRESYPIIIRRRLLTLDEQRRVIWLRFGSLDSMDRRWHSASAVKDMTGVSYSTQYKLIKRWLERNCRVLSLLCLRG